MTTSPSSVKLSLSMDKEAHLIAPIQASAEAAADKAVGAVGAAAVVAVVVMVAVVQALPTMCKNLFKN
ncbi:hypothetical protein BKM16_27605 [Pseudomonas amygdali pv. morsprunorum]|nr:hypothetical protein BKM22_27645 [Pseudomonas amygdali pv. morsprunorum]POD36753.1 hypothetical protein BKM16_27605 [Pseudomonas amygdali pv. morsprunorum]POD38377.1 hypothetical protein BKM02_27485 [Pseudomonas amygdali pv. morsprunorum]